MKISADSMGPSEDDQRSKYSQVREAVCCVRVIAHRRTGAQVGQGSASRKKAENEDDRMMKASPWARGGQEGRGAQ
jgi:hypothetical protein